MPDLKCTNLGKNLIEAALDQQRALKDRNGDFYCYCKLNKDDIKDLPPFPDGQGINYCKNWLDSYRFAAFYL